MSLPVRRVLLGDSADHPAVTREWLVTNGLGGYASGTVSGLMTRRYHGLLIAALPSPMGRVVMLSHLQARIRSRDGRLVLLDAEWPGAGAPDNECATLVEFRLESGLPIWRYRGDGFVIEKRVLMPHRQNTVHVTYRLVDAPGPLTLELRPFMHFRHHESSVSEALSGPYTLTAIEDRFEICAAAEQPTLRLLIQGANSALKFDRLQV